EHVEEAERLGRLEHRAHVVELGREIRKSGRRAGEQLVGLHERPVDVRHGFPPYLIPPPRPLALACTRAFHSEASWPRDLQSRTPNLQVGTWRTGPPAPGRPTWCSSRTGSATSASCGPTTRPSVP